MAKKEKKYRYTGQYEKIYYTAYDIAKLLGYKYYEIYSLFHLAGIKQKSGYLIRREKLPKIKEIIKYLTKEVISLLD